MERRPTTASLPKFTGRVKRLVASVVVSLQKVGFRSRGSTPLRGAEGDNDEAKGDKLAHWKRLTHRLGKGLCFSSFSNRTSPARLAKLRHSLGIRIHRRGDACAPMKPQHFHRLPLSSRDRS